MICDPILCQPLNCTHQVHPEELCCPICEGTWGTGWGVPCENKVGVPLGRLGCWHHVHPLMAFLFLVEKKTEQEELKLERARDSSEGKVLVGKG